MSNISSNSRRSSIITERDRRRFELEQRILEREQQILEHQ